MKDWYNLFYYKIYRFFAGVQYPWWSEWKTTLFLSIWELLFVSSIFIYYKILVDSSVILGGKGDLFVGSSLVITFLNAIYFHKNDRWRSIVKRFDKELAMGKSKMSGWLVFLVIILIFVNLVFAFYQMSLLSKY